ncbi:MAG: hypothetical protein WC129_04700 [Sphaerochaetaceae bacterium]|mgnify:CR=1 FL=1|nr:hypothetical protein [Sphaerochaetaceae bacterium]MDX9808629.1 hypothetical protein [Sphaerochaetaceae bacterium]NLV84028.1 hypothetical protein [Spirochaetales bacterium]
MSRLLRLLCTICVLIFLMVSCERSRFDIGTVVTYPIVARSYTGDGLSYRSEGIAVTVEIDTNVTDKDYHVTLIAPDASFTWECFCTPYTSGSLWYISLSEFLLPPDMPLPVGSWIIEIGLPDGQIKQYPIDVKSISADVRLYDTIPELVWEYKDERRSLELMFNEQIAPSDLDWNIYLFDDNDLLLSSARYTGTSVYTERSNDTEKQSKIVRAVYLTFDKQSGVLLVGRTIFR